MSCEIHLQVEKDCGRGNEIELRLSRTSEVLCARDGFQMLGVHTMSDAAQVVYIKTFRNWFPIKFVSEAVSEDVFAPD